MAKIKGLVFLMNEKPKGNDVFIVRKMYRFVPSFTNVITTTIELELYENNICVISFYDQNKGTNKTKYKIRSNIGPGHTRAIFRACLVAYYDLNQDYALVFSASNDIGKTEEYNARYSAYTLFLTNYFTNYINYIQKGSIALNTLMLYHQSYQYKDEADLFYKEFEERTKHSLTENDDSDKS
jgi:hypothetical protein